MTIQTYQTAGCGLICIHTAPSSVLYRFSAALKKRQTRRARCRKYPDSLLEKRRGEWNEFAASLNRQRFL